MHDPATPVAHSPEPQYAQDGVGAGGEVRRHPPRVPREAEPPEGVHPLRGGLSGGGSGGGRTQIRSTVHPSVAHPMAPALRAGRTQKGSEDVYESLVKL